MADTAPAAPTPLEAILVALDDRVRRLIRGELERLLGKRAATPPRETELEAMAIFVEANLAPGERLAASELYRRWGASDLGAAHRLSRITFGARLGRVEGVRRVKASRAFYERAREGPRRLDG